MGLDMYLTAKTYVKNWSHHAPENRYTVTVMRSEKPVAHIKPERVSFVEEEIGYWRKANHIHRWFVNNVQNGNDDCRAYYVSDDNLEELRDLCQQVVNLEEDDDRRKQKAAIILPCWDGFFFGSTGYDDYYFAACEETIKICDEALASSGEAEIYYRASW